MTRFPSSTSTPDLRRYLADTHAVLWFLDGDLSLPPSARELIQDPTNQVWVSVASLWEAAIKRGLGKLRPPPDLPDLIAAEGFELLAVAPEDAWSVADLPHHHRDPFDRLLIAQAVSRDVPIITGDPQFSEYEVATRW